MSQFTFLGNQSIGSTTVSNLFIDKYMHEANEAQLKIYLYLLRMFSANQATSVSEIADRFNYMEADVIRALQFWEKKHILSLHYNEENSITGLQFIPLQPEAVISPITQAPKACVVETPKKDTASFEKPPYSPSQVRAFYECADSQTIIMFAEQYLQKQLSMNDIKSLFFIYDELHFSEDMIDCLIQYCVDRNKKDFRYIEKVAMAWANDGINTPELAREEMKKREKTVYAIMKALGKSGNPTDKEMEYINRWLKEYAFNMEVISEACGRTVLATDKHRFEYAESILKNWNAAGVHSTKDILSADAAFEKNKAVAAPTYKKVSGGSASSTAMYNQFPQNQYNFEELEKEFLSN